jgi:hypothetical protein
MRVTDKIEFQSYSPQHFLMDKINAETNQFNKGNYLNKFLRLKLIFFKYKLFSSFYKDYYSRTPESDSLYRRRNRLIILFSSIFFYFKTASGVFNRMEVEAYLASLSKKSKIHSIIARSLFIPLGKSLYFFLLLLGSQMFLKYLYYLNKVFKSYQFALEGVLKYNILERNLSYQGDSAFTGYFDICDCENIKKNA